MSKLVINPVKIALSPEKMCRSSHFDNKLAEQAVKLPVKIDPSGIHGYPVFMRSSCPISCALDVFGDNWSLVVLRDVVLLDRRRFSEIAQNEGIATNILSDRLNRLEEKGFIQRASPTRRTDG